MIWLGASSTPYPMLPGITSPSLDLEEIGLSTPDFSGEPHPSHSMLVDMDGSRRGMHISRLLAPVGMPFPPRTLAFPNGTERLNPFLIISI
jgi:hypothetical protein